MSIRPASYSKSAFGGGGAMPLFIPINAQTMHIKTIEHKSIAVTS
jgi:hypothetical protein